MKRFNFLLPLFLIVILLPQAYAQTTPKRGSLADLSFIEGHWKASSDGRTVEATWLAPSGDNIVGFFRMMKEGKVTMYELLAYEQSEQGPVSLVKHFKPGLIGQEEIGSPVRYQFVEAGKDQVIFEQADKPVRVLYKKQSRDKFVISLGKEQEGKWVFTPLFEFSRVK